MFNLTLKNRKIPSSVKIRTKTKCCRGVDIAIAILLSVQSTLVGFRTYGTCEKGNFHFLSIVANLL